MQRIALDSEAITSAGYDCSSSTLELEFTSGALYQYYDVPPGVYEALVKADSHGKYFAAAIRDRYRYRKLEAQLR